MLQRTGQQSIDVLPLDVHELPLAQELSFKDLHSGGGP